MSQDITPLVPVGRQMVQAFGDGGFRITGQDYQGSVLVSLDQTQAWSGDLSPEGLIALLGGSGASQIDVPQILIIGCGPKFTLAPEPLRVALREHGIVLEWMDTAAGCRSFNVLASEERSVMAALIAVE